MVGEEREHLSFFKRKECMQLRKARDNKARDREGGLKKKLTRKESRQQRKGRRQRWCTKPILL